MSTICIAALACKAGAFFGLALRLPTARRSKRDQHPRAVRHAPERNPSAGVSRAAPARIRRR